MSARKKCGYPAAALTIFQRPVRVVQNYVVECQCGWTSQRTTDWVRSLDSHISRSLAAGLEREANK